jgi:GNAT superfamily N-acetyltransferase
MNCSDTTKNNLDKVVHCHESAFPEALSTKLGRRFIVKMLSWYIESDRGIIFHLEKDGEILGYLGGIIIKTPGLPGAATSITQHSFGTFVFSFILKPWLIFHSENLKRSAFILRNLRLKIFPEWKESDYSLKNITGDFTPSMGLVVICVSRFHQGKGYGSVLLQEFEDRARYNNIEKITLSVKKTNYQAIGAYSKNGWAVEREGKEELVMFKNVGSNKSADSSN